MLYAKVFPEENTSQNKVNSNRNNYSICLSWSFFVYTNSAYPGSMGHNKLQDMTFQAPDPMQSPFHFFPYAWLFSNKEIFCLCVCINIKLHINNKFNQALLCLNVKNVKFKINSNPF